MVDADGGGVNPQPPAAAPPGEGGKPLENDADSAVGETATEAPEVLRNGEYCQ